MSNHTVGSTPGYGTYTVAGVTYSTSTGLPIEPVGGITYDPVSGRPLYFDASYDGPKNALVGELNADNGQSYGIYADYKQNNNEIQDSSGNVIYKDFSQFQEGQFPDGVDPSTLSSDDIVRIQSTMGEAGATGNIYDPTFGTGIPSGGALPEGSFGVGVTTTGDYQYAAAKEDPLKHLEFGQVDHILQRLSLRNLKYPIDADYGNTQDYMMINQFTYKPPNKGIFFPEGGMKEGIQQGVNTFLKGVESGTPKEKAIGLVKLPMCNQLVDSNNVSWGTDKLNALTAAVSSAAMGASGGVMNSLETAFKNFDPNCNLLQELFTAGGQLTADTAQGLREGFGATMGGVGDLFGAIRNNPNTNLLGRTVLGSAILNALQFQVSPETILSRGAGVVPNSNLALLFNAPTLREFTFSWKMSPRSKEEAIRINNILRFFKQGMAPKKAAGSRSGGASYFLGTPNIFDINFKTGRSDSDFYEILDRNDSVMRIKTCACTGAAVNYTPQGMWNAYEQGQPVAITLTLRFNELEPIFDTDYDNNYFNFDPQRTDLLPVPTDAVGY